MKKTLFSLIILIVAAFLLSGCEAPMEATAPGSSHFPAIRVHSNNTRIEWVVGANRIGDAEFDRPDHFIRIMEDRDPDGLVYLKNGETVTIEFEGDAPDTVKLTEHILSEEGGVKYATEYEGQTIDIRVEDGSGSFVIEPNYATALSSNSRDYLPGHTLKGYRLLCHWGTDECEYGFVIRGDAAIIMQVK